MILAALQEIVQVTNTVLSQGCLGYLGIVALAAQPRENEATTVIFKYVIGTIETIRAPSFSMGVIIVV